MTTVDGGERLALEDERDVLLRSITDLDAELAAGDLAPADHRRLRDDYTARAAIVMRRLAGPTGEEAGRVHPFLAPGGPFPTVASPPRFGRRWRTAGVVVAVVAVAGAAAWGVAASSGTRLPGQQITSGVPAGGPDPRLAQAQQDIGRGKVLEAIKLYDAVLRTSPNQPEALTYRGWLIRLAGLSDRGLASIERAEAADPSYPDAHVFRGLILLQDRHDPQGAVTEFRTFLSADPPQTMVPLVEDALRQALAQIPGTPPAGAGTPVPAGSGSPDRASPPGEGGGAAGLRGLSGP